MHGGYLHSPTYSQTESWFAKKDQLGATETLTSRRTHLEWWLHLEHNQPLQQKWGKIKS